MSKMDIGDFIAAPPIHDSTHEWLGVMVDYDDVRSLQNYKGIDPSKSQFDPAERMELQHVEIIKPDHPRYDELAAMHMRMLMEGKDYLCLTAHDT